MQTVEATRALHEMDGAAIDRMIRGFWQDRLQDANEAITRVFAADAELRLLGSPITLGGPRVFKGVEAVRDAVRSIDTHLEFLSFTILDLIVDGNEVAFRWHARLRNRGTSAVGDFGVFDHIVVENGQIASYSEFFDTDCFSKLMAGEPVRSGADQRERARPSVIVRDAPIAPAADMPTRIEIADQVRALWADRVVRGSAALHDYLSADCEFHMIGDPAAIPFARSHHGRDAVLDLVRQIDMEFEFLSFDINKILVDGNRAAVHWCGDIRHRGTSVVGHIEAFDHLIFEGMRIRSYTEFFDTAGVSRWIRG